MLQIVDRAKYESQSDDTVIGTGLKFQRIRRITGYLVGSLERFNNAKRAEESERAKHNVGDEYECFL